MKGGFSETARKTVHVAMGGFALLLAYLSWWQALVLAVAAFLHNLLLLPLYARRKVFRGEAGVSGRDTGILLYPASIVVLILVFHRRLEIVAAAWALLAFGDGFATIAGKGIEGPRLPWNRAKTWSGFIAFIAIGFVACRFLYVWTFLGHLHGDGSASGLGGALAAALGPSAPNELASMAGTPLPESFFGRQWFHLVLAEKVGWGTGFVAMIAATTLLAALLESLPLGVDDNLSVPLVSAGFLFALSLSDARVWATNGDQVLSNLPWAIGINAALAAAAYAARSVSVSGVVGGLLMGGALYAFGGWRAFMMLVVFFVLGTVATKTGYARKAALGIAQEKGGRRGARNAIANCGMGALLAYVAAASPYTGLAMLGLVAAFATAACDTVSSEIGQAYGRTTYLITTFRRVPPGTDGAVSLEGTLAGTAAAGVVAVVALALGLVTPLGAALVVLAALFGSTVESYMGAIWERAKLIDNEAINFANTVAGALFAIAAAALVPSASLLP